jgi:hypothetical protein
MMRMKFFGLLAGVAIICTGTAQAQQQPGKLCSGDIINPKNLPALQPTFRTNAGLTDGQFDCMVWQDFIYFMWPAAKNGRGVPNISAKFGAPGPTVWETYRTVDTVFLPNGRDPGPWNGLQLMATLSPSLARQVASGAIRHLTGTSKVSRPVLANVLREGTSVPQAILGDISQAAGGAIYDPSGNPVYYEVAMDEAQYNYIQQNGLYDANKQATFGQGNVISLPFGSTTTDNSVEMKAAWKILTPAERKTGRFHTIEALIEGSKTPVTVGLVGFHVFIIRGDQGAWGTFAQVDNAPVQTSPVTSGTFNFFNPGCMTPGTQDPCPINTPNTDPTQVVQVAPDDATADQLNTYVHSLFTQNDPKSPWQYYNLVNVQWPVHGVAMSTLKAPASGPLPDGQPNTQTLVNAVIETFVQQPGMACLSCHQYGTTAASGSNPAYASSYSFMFGRANAPPSSPAGVTK